jgi:negative regulator of replication initiation
MKRNMCLTIDDDVYEFITKRYKGQIGQMVSDHFRKNYLMKENEKNITSEEVLLKMNQATENKNQMEERLKQLEAQLEEAKKKEYISEEQEAINKRSREFLASLKY